MSDDGAAGEDAAGGVPDADFPADPYPGATPPWSFVHHEGRSLRLESDAAAFAGWRVAGGGEDLDRWLARHDARPMAGRVPVLVFGSNRCPSKLTWLRAELGLPGPVVMLRARVHDLAAVWAAGHRRRDGVRPATLAAVPGAVEVHAVWMATPEQVAVLDVCEGRGERYDLVRLATGRVLTEDGALVDDAWTYWPCSPERAPLLVDGAPVRCSERHHDDVRDLDGEPAPVTTDGVVPCAGAPDPEGWPRRVFAYGTLQPGGRGWPVIAPYVGDGAEGDDGAGSGPSWLAGRVHDTGLGYPALTLARADAGVAARGTVVTLAAAADAFPALDAYEGPEYRRVRSVTYRGRADDAADPDPVLDRAGGGSVCWVWVWDEVADTEAWPVLAERWSAADE